MPKRAIKKRPPGPPQYAKGRQDSFGNPTTKKPGDQGTQVGAHGVWWDMSGAHKPRGTRDWARKAK